MKYTIKDYFIAVRDSWREHFNIVFAKNPYRYANKQLISTEIFNVTKMYYIRAYNQQVHDYCIAFFKKLIAEKINIVIEKENDMRYCSVWFGSGVDFSKVLNQLQNELAVRFNTIE